MKSKVLLITCLLLLTACAIGKDTLETMNFTFTYPNDWKVGNVAKADQFSNVDAFVYKLDDQGNTTMNVNVTHVMVVGELDPGMFADQSIKEAEAYTGYKNVKKQNMKIAGEDTKLHTFFAQGPDGETNLFMQCYVLDGETGYVLTGLMQEDADGTVKATIRNICKSFQLVKKEQ